MDITGIGSIADAIKGIVDKVVPDANIAAQAKAKIDEMHDAGELQIALGNIGTNTEEAKVGQNLKTDWMEFFIAAWRPAIGWMGGLALGYNAILLPASEFVAKVFFHYSGDFPQVNLALLGEVLLGLLGMSYHRSMDKKNGVSNGT